MKVEMISKEELEPFMKYKHLEGMLVAKLQSFNNITKLKLDMCGELTHIARNMKAIKDKHKFKTNHGMMKVIRKYAQW